MFYSHEILTSREGGIATVWLVATLGSRLKSKKINRKAILDVNIPKTCSVITQPEAPMALRLQGNLLYGVSRVFSQQCGYILSDAQIIQSNMRVLLKAVRTSELDSNAGKARPDQLVIHDDPAFLPDLTLPGLDIDLSALDISTDSSSRRSSIFAPHSQHSSLTNHTEADESMLGLMIPSSYSEGAGDLGGFILPGENLSSARRNARIVHLLDDDDEGFNNNPGFTIDADGNLVEERTPGPGAAPADGLRLGSDSAASNRLRREIMEGQRSDRFELDGMNLDFDLPQLDNDVILPEAEAFPTTAIQASLGPGNLSSLSQISREQESSNTAEAPIRRMRRALKPLPVDDRTELHSIIIARWNSDYLANMAEAKSFKMSHKAPFLAKKNAAFFVYGAGINGVGAGLGRSKLQSPLAMFSGDSLMTSLTGMKISGSGRKRGRKDEEGHDSDSEARRVRIRDDVGNQIRRGNGMMLDDDGMIMDVANNEVEVGRHALPPLEDPSMPWNVSSAIGSRQGSVAHGRGMSDSVGGFPTSAGTSSVPLMSTGAGWVGRRASRIPSASPLGGRGRQRYSSLEIPPIGDNDELLGGQRISGNQTLDDFHLYGPAAAVDTQTAGQSQWMRATLNQEANNFLDFVKAEITAHAAHTSDDEDELSGEGLPQMSLSFEQLLPPTKHSKIVAAQALHHLLVLASKSLVSVRQGLPNGPIDLSLPGGI